MSRRLIVLSMTAFAGLFTTGPLAAQEVTPTNFNKLVKLIKPTPQESYWSKIPWLRDMNVARKRAAAQGKPLVVWSMSGEALGTC